MTDEEEERPHHLELATDASHDDGAREQIERAV